MSLNVNRYSLIFTSFLTKDYLKLIKKLYIIKTVNRMLSHKHESLKYVTIVELRKIVRVLKGDFLYLVIIPFINK